MKKSKSVSSSGRSKAPKTKRQKVSSTSPSPLLQSTAPYAVSTSLRPSVSYTSSVVDGRPALRVTACQPLCQIGNDAHNNGLYLAGAGTFPATSTVASLSMYSIPESVYATSSVPAEVTNLAWISPHIPLMAQAFDRYRVHDLEFIYEPQASATNGDRMVFAWTDDPQHPFLSTATLAIVPNQLQQLVTPDSVAFMPWKPWRLRVPVARDSRFMYDSTTTAVDPQTARFSQFGCMSCVGSLAPSMTTQYGILYIRITADLFDPVPIVTGAALFGGPSLRKRPVKEECDEKKTDALPVVCTDDVELVSPPKFTPLPSTAVGTPGYTSRALIPFGHSSSVSAVPIPLKGAKDR